MTPEVMLDRLHLLQSIVAGMIAEVKSAQLIRELNEPDHADLRKPAPVFVTNTPRPGDKPGSRPTWEERERDRENNGGHY